MDKVASTLLIDDESYIADALRDALEDEGLPLDVATTWVEGMELFSVVGHELVIADYDLREARSGLELLAEVKKLVPSTRLVLISGRLPADSSDQLNESGAVDIFLMKTDREFRATIIREAQLAADRALGSDWQAVGAAHPRAQEVDAARLADLERTLRERMVGE